jgi:uncharacterized Ntn-hydrolase superfamily protein
MVIKVNGKEYKLKFGYRVMAKTALLQDVISMQNYFKGGKNALMDKLSDLIELNSNLVLAGLQKYNEDFRVDYDNEESVKQGLEKVYDIMEDYMDDPESAPVIDLFSDMVEELTDNGFLSKKSLTMEEAAIAQDATIIPMDHKQGN